MLLGGLRFRFFSAARRAQFQPILENSIRIRHHIWHLIATELQVYLVRNLREVRTLHISIFVPVRFLYSFPIPASKGFRKPLEAVCSKFYYFSLCSPLPLWLLVISIIHLCPSVSICGFYSCPFFFLHLLRGLRFFFFFFFIP